MYEDLLPGDIILTEGIKLTVWFLRLVQSDNVEWGHISTVGSDDDVIQAKWKIVSVPIFKFFKRHKHYKIIRRRTLKPETRIEIAEAAFSRVGRSYSITRLCAQGFDNLFNTNFFSALNKDHDEHICSSFIAWAYWKATAQRFNNVWWVSVEPDDIDDEAINNPTLWKVIEER